LELWKSSGAERIARAARRNALLIVIIVVLSTAGTVLLGQTREPSYTSEARVLISQQDLGATLTGGSQTVDPQRVQATELDLANSDGLYQRTASVTQERYGTADELSDSVAAKGTADSDVITFTGVAPTAGLAEARVDAVTGEFVKWRAELSAEPIDRAITLAREALAERPDATDLRDKLGTLQVLRTLNSGRATLVENANEATEMRPDPIRNAVIGFAAGLVIALLIVALREFLDNRIREVEDVEGVLGRTPLWGVIPTLPRRGEIAAAGADHRITDSYALLLAAVSGHLEETSARTFVITSSSAGDGKSATVLNLGLIAARAEMKVLIVDGDERRRGLTAALRLPKGVLASQREGGVGAISSRTALHMANIDIGRTKPDGVVIIQGHAFHHPSAGRLSFLSISTNERGAFDRDVASLRPLLRDFDLVLLDSPPSLETATALDLSRVADGIIVIARSGHTRLLRMRRLLRQLQSWRTPVVGAIMTDASSAAGYGYYGTNDRRALPTRV
jgi:receptor protein-tyrosine kinase